MQVKTVWRLGIVMTTMLGAVSLVAQTGILALEQPERPGDLGRYVWTNVSSKSDDFEQSFSDDGNQTWEPNWITTMEHEVPSKADVPPNADKHDGQHDFDF